MQIQTQQQLDDLCRRARTAGCFGIDLEFIPENTYYPELALIQLAVDEDCFIVDPLKSLNLSELEHLICSNDVITIVHAGTQDMGIFFHRTGLPPKRVFDTQIAASFVGMGHQVSYGSMVQQLFGVSLKKGQSYTNWLKRPLLPEQIQYALEDVAYLVGAYRTLSDSLVKMGRLEWVTDELQRYEEDGFYTDHAAHPESRVKKTGQMRGREQAVLEAVARWREDEAQRRNLPRKKILTDYAVVDIAKRRPKTEGELFSLRSAEHVSKRYATELIQIVAQTMGAPLTEQPDTGGIFLTEDQKLLVEFLTFCLKAFCQKEQLSNVALATRSELEFLVADFTSGAFEPAKHRILCGWRRTAAGNDMLRCLRGEMGVRYDGANGRLLFWEGQK